MKLLSYSNVKTIKGEKLGVKTAILYLAPGSISGVNLCGFSSKGCLKACLYTSGMGKFSNVQAARIAKTHLFLSNRKAFVEMLKKDILAHIKRAKKEEMTPAVRLNGTSDIAWENEKGEDGKNLMESFPFVQFYDYAKSPFRALKFAKGGELPTNYHLTFSRSESNQTWVDKMPIGISVAMVFSTKKGEALPLEYGGRIVIDGDETDARFLDPIFKSGKGTIVGLRSKGSGKKDTSGFVIQVGGNE
jgi:hypothetical protein